MNIQVKKLLSKRESAAYEGLLDSSHAHELQVFVKMKLADLVAFNLEELNEAERSFASNVCFDFVLAKKDYTPCLAIDSDHIDESNENSAAEAELKLRICNELGLALVRIDCSQLALYQVAEAMHILIDDFIATQRKHLKQEAATLEYHGCLIHPDTCTFSRCSEFEELAPWLIWHEQTQRKKNIDAAINVRSYVAPDSYCVGEIFIQAEGEEQIISTGRCRTSTSALDFGLRLAKSLAACTASRIIEDTRNFVFLSEEPCSIDLKWTTVLSVPI